MQLALHRQKGEVALDSSEKPLQKQKQEERELPSKSKSNSTNLNSGFGQWFPRKGELEDGQAIAKEDPKKDMHVIAHAVNRNPTAPQTKTRHKKRAAPSRNSFQREAAGKKGKVHAEKNRLSERRPNIVRTEVIELTDDTPPKKFRKVDSTNVDSTEIIDIGD